MFSPTDEVRSTCPESEKQLRSAIEDLSNQLCKAVDGDFDFMVKTNIWDDTVEKLQMLVNFVIDVARRSLSDLEAQNAQLTELGRMKEERTRQLSQTNEELSREIAERKQAEEELQVLQERHISAARRAGMAEIATSVLHNVGNVLNSVNVSAAVISDKIRESGVPDMTQAIEIMQEHLHDLETYTTEDERGQHLPRYLIELSKRLAGDEEVILEEVQSLSKNIEHIKNIISVQQSYTGVAGLVEEVSLDELLRDAIRINSAATLRHELETVCEFEDLPLVATQKQKFMQIVVNLISNAKYALIQSNAAHKRMIIRLLRFGDHWVRVEVSDTGVGIPEENLTRMFSHGFTTREEGHGFGLHSAAIAAKELGGMLTAHSDGPGTGATFTLEIPFQTSGVRSYARSG